MRILTIKFEHVKNFDMFKSSEIKKGGKMNKEDFLNNIFNELRAEKDLPFTIVCCFNSRRDMKNAIQSLLDKFIYIRRTKINIGDVADSFSIKHENTYVYFFLDGSKNIDGINPSQLYIQEGFYHSNITDVFKYKLSAVKNSQLFYFEME